VSHFPLETERLLIRPPCSEDAEQLHAVYGDPEAMRCIPGGAAASIEETRRRVARYIDVQAECGFTLWAVVEKSSGQIIGDCGLFPLEGRGPEVEIAYRFGRAHWGRGYATEAARAFLALGFDGMGFHRIIGRTEARNAPSARVLEKLGMRREGLLVENEWVKGEWQSELVYAMLEHEWR
jgi:RimJ/RimL family protein N-acetyltransferase